MSNEEQHELLCSALSKCVEILDCEELSLIANLCGVKIEDFYGPTPIEIDMFNEQTRLAA